MAVRDFGAEFWAMHIKGKPLLMPNPWDLGSARVLKANGAKALATSSAAQAFTLGRPDMGYVSRDEAIQHAVDIIAATDLPLNGDFENGYGHSPEEAAETVKLSGEAGIAGCSIEDTKLPSHEPYPFEDAVDRIKACVDAARLLPRKFVLTARADGVMNDQYDVQEAISRLKAFEQAGADVLYAPVPPSMNDIKTFCEVLDKPVNAICAGPFTKYSWQDFADAGVARISLGSSLARITHRALVEATTAMFNVGDMTPLGHSIGGNKIDQMLIKAGWEE